MAEYTADCEHRTPRKPEPLSAEVPAKGRSNSMTSEERGNRAGVCHQDRADWNEGNPAGEKKRGVIGRDGGH